MKLEFLPDVRTLWHGGVPSETSRSPGIFGCASRGRVRDSACHRRTSANETTRTDARSSPCQSRAGGPDTGPTETEARARGSTLEDRKCVLSRSKHASRARGSKDPL